MRRERLRNNTRNKVSCLGRKRNHKANKTDLGSGSIGESCSILSFFVIFGVEMKMRSCYLHEFRSLFVNMIGQKRFEHYSVFWETGSTIRMRLVNLMECSLQTCL